MLKYFQGATIAKKMFENIHNFLQRHTLLYKLRAHRKIHTVEMRAGERVLSYIDRVQHLGSVLRSMDVDTDGGDMAMVILIGLPIQFEIVITALDAIGDENESFTLNLVKSRLLQEKQRREMRSQDEQGASTLIWSYGARGPSVQVPTTCTYCKSKSMWKIRPSTSIRL